MTREFNRNIFIMLFAIMIGIIIITYFVADIVNRSKIETLTTEYDTQITTMNEQNQNFINCFFKASIVLDQAREDRAFGNYHFDLAFLWYNSALYEKDNSTLELYKTRGIDNCTESFTYYLNSYANFGDATAYFKETISNTTYYRHKDLINQYINLTYSGSNLSMLRYNASSYLMYLLENLTFDPLNNSAAYTTNVSNLLGLFYAAMDNYNEELTVYDDIQQAIDEYEFFDEIR
jgi:hypothetical protein